MRDAKYTGWIRREGRNVTGEIFDSFGWRIKLEGEPGERDGVACFVLTGTLGEIPETFKVPFIDDEGAG